MVAVVGHQREEVGAHIQELVPDVVLAIQEEQHGTGDAVRVAMEAVTANGGAPRGTVLVAYADTPLLEGESLRTFATEHEAAQRAVSILSGIVTDPFGYGRVVRNADGDVEAIVEEKDASDEQREIREINSGILAFDAEFLLGALPKLSNDNAKGEYYLTDTVQLARDAGLHVGAHPIDDVMQTEGANDRAQLADLGREMNRRILLHWMREGVTVMDPATTWVDSDVVLAPDVTLLPGTQLLGATVVAEDAVIGPDTTLKDCEIGAGARVVRTHGELAVVGAGATVGPFAYLRPGTQLGADGKIGTFVETKNAVIGDGAKVPHLSYVGDAEIGEGTNIGAGTIFANYDGLEKHRTDRRQARADRLQQHVRRAGGDRGRCQHRGRHRRTPRRTARRPRRQQRTPAQPQGLGAQAAQGDGAGRGGRGRARPRRSGSWASRRRWGTISLVTGMKRTTEKNLMVFSGRAHPRLAEEVADLLGTELVPQSAYEFANSEKYVRYEESVRGCDAFVIQSHTAPINEWIMEHLIMVDALKRASAKRITVVMPFYGYARQDKKHRGREPITARLMADLFKTAGADRLITVDLHADQIQGFFDGPVDHLMALPILADHVKARYGDQQMAVVSPDAGRIKVAERWSARLGGVPLAFIHKTRSIDRPNEAVANRVVGDVTGPAVRAGRRHDRHRRHDHQGVRGADGRRRRGRGHRGHPRDPLRPGRRPAQELPGARGRGHRHAAADRRPGVRQAHLPVHRPAGGPRDPRGLRGRLGHLDVRREAVSATGRTSAGSRPVQRRELPGPEVGVDRRALVGRVEHVLRRQLVVQRVHVVDEDPAAGGAGDEVLRAAADRAVDRSSGGRSATGSLASHRWR